MYLSDRSPGSWCALACDSQKLGHRANQVRRRGPMRLPRLTTRRLMVLVAISGLLALVVRMQRLSATYRQRAIAHLWAHPQRIHISHYTNPVLSPRERWNMELMNKYNK